MEKFSSSHLVFRAHKFTCAPDHQAQKKRMSQNKVRVQSRNSWKLCKLDLNLNWTYNFLFQCISVESLCNEAFRFSDNYRKKTPKYLKHNTSENVIFLLSHPPKG